MKLSRLYSNDARFHSIIFNDGLNVVLGKVTRRYDMLRDSHNLGKSSLIEVLDFMMLKELKAGSFFRKYARIFYSHVFYLEIILDDATYLTIRRSVTEPTKISFKRGEASCECNEDTHWDLTLAFSKSKEYLNEQLGFNVLPSVNYRSTVSFYLRTQKDYFNVFQLSKNLSGKQRNWKPVVFELLGYEPEKLNEKYDLDQQLEDLDTSVKSITSEMSINADDYDRIQSALDLKKCERDEVQCQVDAFNFYASERSINQHLVEEIETKIAELNSREYSLTYDFEKMKQSLENVPLFDIDQLKQIYAEVEVYFPDNIAHSYEDLLQFNIKVTKERNKYLREQMEALDEEIKSVRAQLNELNEQRNQALASLQDKDTFHKFKQHQKQLAQLEGEVSRLELQLKNIDIVSGINEKVDELKLKLKDVTKELVGEVKKPASQVTSSIKRSFNEIFRTVFGVSALLYVKTNTKGNVEFCTDVAPNEDAEATAEGNGDTYYKIMCAAFDLAVLATYSGSSYFKFAYHDGILEGLDNRKKELYIQVIRQYCSQYGLQYIFSTIEDDVPESILNQLTREERCLELNDSDDSGKLFGFSF
mgnify:CR=1 FL=1